MTSVTEMGGIIMPPVPAFYARPQTLDDMVEHSVGRALDLFDIDTGILAGAKRSASENPEHPVSLNMVRRVRIPPFVPATNLHSVRPMAP